MPPPNAKPLAGERATQLVDEAFRYVRLTRTCAIAHPATEHGAPEGPIANAVFVRAAVIALVAKYNLSGEETVQMSNLAAWRLSQENIV